MLGRAVLVLISFLLFSCSDYSQEEVEQSLDIILKDDMSAIVKDVDNKYLLDKPHYKVVLLKKYPKSKYLYNSEVDFYFLNDNSFKITRKFRFRRDYGKWERYYNEYATIKE